MTGGVSSDELHLASRAVQDLGQQEYESLVGCGVDRWCSNFDAKFVG